MKMEKMNLTTLEKRVRELDMALEEHPDTKNSTEFKRARKIIRGAQNTLAALKERGQATPNIVLDIFVSWTTGLVVKSKSLTFRPF